MKTSVIHFRISTLLLFLVFLPTCNVLLAQDETDIPRTLEDKWALKMQQDFSLLMDTVYPMLNYDGIGLLHFDSVYLKEIHKIYLIYNLDNENPLLLKATYTELDLENLKKNMLYMNKQYQIQMKVLIRKEKLDWNLGETIKDFYLNPIY